MQEDSTDWNISPSEFQQQVEWLATNFDVLTVSEAYRRYQQSALPDNPAVLTFDDGLESTYRAVSVLDDHEIHGTFYIITGLLDELWVGERVMSRDDVKQLAAAGHEIGVHTVSHPALSELPQPSVRSELSTSRADLERLIGATPSSVAYPFGDYDHRVIEVVQELGFETALTFPETPSRGFDHPLELDRIRVVAGRSFSEFKDTVRSSRD